MDYIAIEKTPSILNEETTRTTVSNAICLANETVKALIGVDLSSNKDINLESLIATVVGNELKTILPRGESND